LSFQKRTSLERAGRPAGSKAATVAKDDAASIFPDRKGGI
jgi:hypothetical protein